ncbi:hypothetical protein FHG87_017621 [Trinorchestia longiramus]|nr:hypothetical protein FHG87_017621 [Trinorchestia longiramus]
MFTSAFPIDNVDCDSWIVDAGATQHMCNKKSQFSSYSDLSSPVRVEIGDGRALKGVGVGDSGTKGYGLYDFNAKRILLSRDVVFNECEFMSFEKEPSKEIECVPWFPQEEKYEDSEGELELRRSTRNRTAPDRFGEWVCFAQDKFDVLRAFCSRNTIRPCCLGADPPLIKLCGGSMQPGIPPSIFNVPSSCLPSPKPAPHPVKVEDQQLRYFLQKDKITLFDAFKPERNLQKQYKNLIISRLKERLVCLFMTDNFTDGSIPAERVKEAAVAVKRAGGSVIGSITENLMMNLQYCKLFDRLGDCSATAKHPLDNERVWFLLFDTLHLLKCIRNNWISEKGLKISLDNETTASFADVKELYESEKSSILTTTTLNLLSALHDFNYKMSQLVAFKGAIAAADSVAVLSSVTVPASRLFVQLLTPLSLSALLGRCKRLVVDVCLLGATDGGVWPLPAQPSPLLTVTDVQRGAWRDVVHTVQAYTPPDNMCQFPNGNSSVFPRNRYESIRLLSCYLGEDELDRTVAALQQLGIRTLDTRLTCWEKWGGSGGYSLCITDDLPERLRLLK